MNMKPHEIDYICIQCNGHFGIDIETIVSSSSLAGSYINAQVKTKKTVLRIPFKMACDRKHWICSICIDKIRIEKNVSLTSLQIACSICKFSVGGRTNLEVDNELFTKAYHKQSEMCLYECDRAIQNDLTPLQNEKNKIDIKNNLHQFILPCYHCRPNDSRSTRAANSSSHHLKNMSQHDQGQLFHPRSVRNKSDNVYSTRFCPSCLTACCDSCFNKDHAAHNFPIRDLKDIELSDLLCNYTKESESHGQRTANKFCIEENIFICHTCICSGEHKRHDFAEFLTTKQREEMIMKHKLSFGKLVSSLKSKINILQNKIEQLPLDKAAPTFPRQHYNKEFEKGRDLDLKKRGLEQCLAIAHTIHEEFSTGLLSKPEYKIMHIMSWDKKKNIEEIIQEYYNLINEYFEVESSKKTVGMTSCTSSSKVNHSQNKRVNPQIPIPYSSQNGVELSNKLSVSSIASENSRNRNCFSVDQTTIDSNSSDGLIEEEYAELEVGYSNLLLVNVKYPTLIYVMTESNQKKKQQVDKHLRIWCNDKDSIFTPEEINNITINDNVIVKTMQVTTRTTVYYRGVVTKVTRNEQNDSVIESFKVKDIDTKYVRTINPADSSHEIRKPCPSLEEFGDLVTKCHLHNIKPYGQDEILADKGSYKWDLCGPIKFILNDFHPNSIIKTRITIVTKANEFGSYGIEISSNRTQMIKSDVKLQSLVVMYHIKDWKAHEAMVRYKLAKYEDEEFEEFLIKNMYGSNDVTGKTKMQSLAAAEVYSVNQKVLATVSHFDDLKAFYLKRFYPDYDTTCHFNNMLNRLTAEYSENSLLHVYYPEVGMPVAVYSPENNMWCRGEIVHIVPESAQCDVSYVDFGNTERMPFDSICYLRRDFLQDDVITFKCRLFGLEYVDDESYSQAGAYISKAFEGNTGSGGVLQIDIRNIIDTSNMPGMVNKLLYEVVIRAPVEGAKNVNLNVFLVKLGLARLTTLSIYDGDTEQVIASPSSSDPIIPRKEHAPSLLEKEIKIMLSDTNKMTSKPKNSLMCKVTNAVSPDEIWIQDTIDSEKFFGQFQKLLKEKYTKLIENNEIKPVGDAVLLAVNELLALRKSSNFYRVRIVEASNKKNKHVYKVVCMDNGLYEDNVEPNNLYELTDQERFIPEFKAKRCYLSGLQPLGTTDGKWSTTAMEFINMTLTDQYVYVMYESPMLDANNNNNNSKYSTNVFTDTHQISIYVNIRKTPDYHNLTVHEIKEIRNNPLSHASNEFVRFSDLINFKGYALLTDKMTPFDLLLNNRNFLCNQSSSSLITVPCHVCFYPSPDLPKRVYKSNITNSEAYFDAVVTYIEIPQLANNNAAEAENSTHLDHVICYINFVNSKKLKQTCSLRQLFDFRSDFEKCYKSNNDKCRYHLNFLDEMVKKKKLQACVIKTSDNRLFFRGEIVGAEPTKHQVYLVKLIDYGQTLQVHYLNIFRPMNKYLKTPKLAYRVKVNSTGELDLSETIKNLNLKGSLNDVFCNKFVKVRVDTIRDPEDVGEEVLIVGDVFEESSQESISNLISMSENSHDESQAAVGNIFRSENKLKSSMFSIYGNLYTYVDGLVIDVNPTWSSIDKFTNEIYVWLQLTFDDEEIRNRSMFNSLTDKMNLISNYITFKNCGYELSQMHAQKLMRKLVDTDQVIKANIKCCAHFDGDDLIYRANIVSVDYRAMTATVYYVDFGNDAVVDFDRLYQVPDKYIDLPSQAFKVKLKYIKLAQHLNDDEKLKKIDSELNDLIGNADGRRMLAKFYCDCLNPQNESPIECVLYFEDPMEQNVVYRCLIDDPDFVVSELELA